MRCDMPRQSRVLTSPENARSRQRHFAKENVQESGGVGGFRNPQRQLTGNLAVVQNEVVALVEFDQRGLRRLRRFPRIVDVLK
jgi:hypothetical protein